LKARNIFVFTLHLLGPNEDFAANAGLICFIDCWDQGNTWSVALFEPDDEMVFGNQVFIDEKPDFYSFANKTEDMTGAECFAKSAPPAES